ncbi:hypothetical protein Q0Y04_04335 [Clostridioides difficile]|nr:hypothetical protein Q0Y04_04335 [Clostridioides difficile]
MDKKDIIEKEEINKKGMNKKDIIEKEEINEKGIDKMIGKKMR